MKRSYKKIRMKGIGSHGKKLMDIVKNLHRCYFVKIICVDDIFGAIFILFVLFFNQYLQTMR